MRYYKTIFSLMLVAFTVLIIGGFHFPEVFGTAIKGKQAFVISAIALTIVAAITDLVGHHIKFTARDEDTNELINPPGRHDYVIMIAKGIAAIGVVALIMSRAEDISGVDKDDFALSQQRQIEQPATKAIK